MNTTTDYRQNPDAGMALVPAPDWSQLANMQVEITVHGRLLRKGLVDSVTADGSALWLAMEGVSGRQLFIKSEGVEAWVRPGPVRAQWVMSNHGSSR